MARGSVFCVDSRLKFPKIEIFLDKKYPCSHHYDNLEAIKNILKPGLTAKTERLGSPLLFFLENL